MSTLTGGDGSESLLTCCVPYLQLDSLPIQLNCANFKVNTAKIVRLPSERAKLSAYPIVVMKEGVKESSEKRRSRQLFPTPTTQASRMRKCTDEG